MTKGRNNGKNYLDHILSDTLRQPVSCADTYAYMGGYMCGVNSWYSWKKENLEYV